ncbi:TM2 domain-containing protein [Prevotella jejuni]|jgi:putative TM2 domain family protein|uniref:TM2 domain-containing protein n=1 Tax=Prevotella jejuni TaxID=1177574 RepID=UPI001BA69C37|nr:TM2 domain-containing protein [Prevotella jejuni]QUB77975.1 TM2 domain-containing protein [Prevotella jejuni]
MESEQLNSILVVLSSKIPAGCIPSVRARLESSNVSAEEIMALTNQMTEPTVAIILSIFLGVLGVDRFYIGDTGIGVGKLLTFGGCYIWWLIDIFLIIDATKQKNFELLSRYLAIAK